MPGVHWATVNQVTTRVVVAFDRDVVDLAEIVRAVETVEAEHDLEAEPFGAGWSEHPGDTSSLNRHLWAIGADCAAAGLGLLLGAARLRLLPPEVAALLSVAESTPAVRGPVEGRLGPTADLGLAVATAVAQGLAGGPLGPVVDAVHRYLLVRELVARRQVWERREPDLVGPSVAHRVAPPPVSSRGGPVPPGPVEDWERTSGVGSLLAGATALVATRDPRLAVAATVAGSPRAARVGRDAFAAVLGRLLAERGLLAVEVEALRRLDRVDTVLIDADVLGAPGRSLGDVWVAEERAAQEEALRLTTRMLFDDRDAATAWTADGWTLGPVDGLGGSLPGPGRAALRALRRRGGSVLALCDRAGVAALVEVQPASDPLAPVAVEAARAVGEVVVGGLRSPVAHRVAPDRLVPGGSRLASQVRALQADGRVVAVVSSRQRLALAAADVGIGVTRDGGTPPWGAHLIADRGLLDVWLVLQAVPVARAVSRRSRTIAVYGSGAAAVLALAGPRRGATMRAALGASAATGASLVAGAAAAVAAVRRPEPLPPDPTDWHALPAAEALARLSSGLDGLTDDDVRARRRAAPDGVPAEPSGLLHATVREMANPLTPALASGAGLAAAAGSLTDAGLIGSVMSLNALVGGLQQVGADRALHRLLDEAAVRVHVRRQGVDVLTTADQLVPGDVVVLRAGDAVPADCRILEARGVEVDESSLTGESQLVAKSAQPSAARAAADRHSMLYTGTALAAGESTAVVVATGHATQLGRASSTSGRQRRPSGVETRLRRLTATTLPLSLAAGTALFATGLLRGRPAAEGLGTGIGLAVAAVPEGLPLVATVAQLASARRLSQRNALVRHATTIETLGRVDVLCADKTGTLTTGEITLQAVWDGVADQPVDSLGPAGRAVLATAVRATPGGRRRHLAHPTDRAVRKGARRAGVTPVMDASGWEATDELPFEPVRGYHAVLGRVPGGALLSVKGAPEVVLPRCSSRQGPDGATPLDDEALADVCAVVDRLARRGYRVLAVAERPASDAGDLDDERVARLLLVGLLALGDPVRETASAAVRGLRAAGVDVVMVTGDHPSTAEAIAAELGLLDGRQVLTGPQMDELTDEDLGRALGSVSVFARVTPAHKVRIVEALQRAGHVVAMTGDGANDAPAIRLADVGVALGRRGTNAAREAADVVVTDDRIETIIDAIVEGRAMWASVRDAVAVLLGGNLGEIALALVGGLLPGGGPLNARQLLLVNLFTDLVPAMALAVRPPAGTDPDTLAHEGPETSLADPLTREVLVRGAATAAAGAMGWAGGRVTGLTGARAGTVALVSLVGSQLGQTLAAGWRSPVVVASTIASGAGMVAVVQTPGLSHLMGCRPLGPVGWAVGGGAAGSSTLAAAAANKVLRALAR
ncbi:MAG: HAD-IC family P-type ATPase [Actinomycetes bacterium]